MTGPNAVSDVRLGFVNDIPGAQGFPSTPVNTPGPDDDWLFQFPQTGVYSDVKISQADVLYMAYGDPYLGNNGGVGGNIGVANGNAVNNAVFRCDYPLADNVHIPTITTPSNPTGPAADTPHWYVGNGNTYPLHNAYSPPARSTRPLFVRPPATSPS